MKESIPETAKLISLAVPALPPALNGYRRTLYTGRAASVYFDRHPANKWEEHAHEQHQVSGLVGQGTCLVKWQDSNGVWSERIVSAPAYWVIPMGMPHALICPDGVEMVTLFMGSSFVADVLRQRLPEFITVNLAQLAGRDPVIANHSKTFLRLCKSEDNHVPLYIESIGTILGAHVLQALFSGNSSLELRAGLPDEDLKKIIKFVDEHLGKPLAVHEMSRATRFSPGHFGVLFKRSLGLSPHSYLMRCRLGRARELLATTTRKELDIALECGFSDDTHLARWTRELLDCLPKQLRGQGVSGKSPVFPVDQPSLTAGKPVW